MHVARNLGCLRVAAAGLIIGAATVLLPIARAQSISITTITPSCASVGDSVTISGAGFNTPNVAVGGVPAPLGNANTNSVTFTVPVGVRLGATTVTAANPGGQPVSINFRVCDLLLPSVWGGSWRITVTYSDPVTNAITTTDRYTTFIRAGEPFGVMSIANLANCTGSVSSTGLQVMCSGHSGNGVCTTWGAVQIAATLSPVGISGSGWSAVSFSGSCGSPPPQPNKRNIQIAGQQLSPFQNPSGTPTTLFRNFVPLASLIAAGQ